MAAGEGTRLRPLTERWAKPVLPIDGRPVLAVLLRELAAAGLHRVWLVTGHLAEQVEALGRRRIGVRARAHSGPATRRAGLGGRRPACARRGRDPAGRRDGGGHGIRAGRRPSVRRCDRAAAAGAAGAVAVRREPPPGPGRGAVRSKDGRVTSMADDDPANSWSGAPLWMVDRPVAERLVPGPAALRAREGVPVRDRRRRDGYVGRDREDPGFDVSA